MAGAAARGAIAATALLLPCAASAVPPASSGTEATRRIAGPFLQQLFVANDVTGAYRRFAAPDFVQHNPEMADGIAGHEAFFAVKARTSGGSPARWANVTDMVLVDGDLFAVMHHRFSDADRGGAMFVDIWRVAGDRIVEHWDVIQPIPASMGHGNGMGCGDSRSLERARALGARLDDPTCGRPDRAASRAASLATVAVYGGELGRGDVAAGVHRWFAPRYVQHSPAIADGATGAIDHLAREYGDPAAPRPHFGPVRTIAEGDYVLLHRLVSRPGRPPTVNVDIFRVTGGKISEHWDVAQPVPASTVSGHGVD